MEYISNPKREQAIAEEMWLLYFNKYLFEHNIITQREYGKMLSKIYELMARKAN